MTLQKANNLNHSYENEKKHTIYNSTICHWIV